MATIIGDYKFTVNVNGKECVLEDKVRLEKIIPFDRSNPERYAIKLCIKGSAKLSKFLFKMDRYTVYSNSMWYNVNYTTIRSFSETNNNKIFEIIYKLNERIDSKVKYEDRIGFNYCSNSNRELTSNSTNIKSILEWVKRAKNRQMPILKFNGTTLECKKCGFVKLNINIDKKKVLAIII